MPLSTAVYNEINDLFKRLKRLYNTDVFDQYIDELIPYEIIRRLSNNKMFEDEDRKELRDLYNRINTGYDEWSD